MQWERVKSIFIGVFFFINVFLTIMLLSRSDAGSITAADAGNVVAVLAKQGISIDAALIQRKQSPVMLYDASNSYVTHEEYARDLADALSTTDLVKVAQYTADADHFVVTAELVSSGDNRRIAAQLVKLASITPPALVHTTNENGGEQFYYMYMLSDTVVMDQHLVVDVNGDRAVITGVNWLGDRYAGGASADPLPLIAILCLTPRFFSPDEHSIVAVEAGYLAGARDNIGKSTVSLTPCWRIDSEQRAYYFDALNGDLLTP